LTTVH